MTNATETQPLSLDEIADWRDNEPPNRRKIIAQAVAVIVGVVSFAIVAVLAVQTISPGTGTQPTHFYNWHGKMPTGITLSGLQAYLFSSDNVVTMDNQAHADRHIWLGNTDRIQAIQDKTVGANGKKINWPYVHYIRRVVAGALRQGLTVVINDQTEQCYGWPLSEPLPTRATVAFWRVMMRFYKNNSHVAFDLFNEPRKIGWGEWLKGQKEHGTRTYIGMQAMVNEIRRAGARNQIWIEGLRWDSTLSGVPILHDPLRDLVYTIHHPGSDAGGTVTAPTNAQLDDVYGGLPERGFRVVDAEFTNAKGSFDWHHSARNVRRYFRYLTREHIGLLCWSLLPGSLNANLDYASVSREPEGDGALVMRQFAKVSAQRHHDLSEPVR